MISEKLAHLFSNLSRDNVNYFSENWSEIIKSSDVKENFLSYCLESKSFKVFDFAVKKGLTEIRSIILANAIRSDDEKVISLIIENNLFQYDSKKATDILSISVSNNDTKVINFLLKKVKVSPDILMFALAAKNKVFLTKFIDDGFTWNYSLPEQNPLVFIIENYNKEQAEYIDLIISKSSQADKLINDARFYFEGTEDSLVLDKILKKD